jgi:acyl-CoA synthetase (AMP-forming)/AMP-acid ligase II
MKGTTRVIATSDYLINVDASATKSGGYTLPAVFEVVVAAKGDEPAVFDGTRFHTWHEWAHDARALARAFQEMGVSAGDVVAVHLPNSWEYLIGHVAIAMIGAVMMPIHMAYGEHELRVLLERTSASALVMPASYHKRDLLAVGQRLLATQPSLRHLLLVGTKEQTDISSIDELVRQWAGMSPRPVHITPDDPFALLASSGTTSLRPKICMHSHNGLLSNASAAAIDGRAREDDTLVSASPFTHAFGLFSIHLSIFSRGRQALLPGWNLDDFLDVAHRSGATVAFLVPAQLRDVCAHLDTHSDAPRIRLREVRSGGAKVPATLVADARRLLGAGVIVQWGMSEVGAGTFTRPDDPPEAASSSIGRPVTHGEFLIADDNGQELPSGESGELWYRSPYMFRGYLHDPELTRQAVTADGWLRTSDLASRNEDGNIAYQGRRTELINRGGLKFSAVEVESLLSDMPQLNQFAVISRPDPRLGERAYLVAAVRPGSTITLDDVVAHLAAKGLAKYKWPEDLILIEELPSTATGKIARARLIDQLKTISTS